MKEPPEKQRLENVLRSSKLVSGGFLGDDNRKVDEIIEEDSAAVFRAGYTVSQIAARMHEITDLARTALGATVTIDNLRARIIEVRGRIPCPWPHAGRYGKDFIVVEGTESGKTIRWSELSLHMIEAHGFFEGRGSPFRLEPDGLIHLLF